MKAAVVSAAVVMGMMASFAWADCDTTKRDVDTLLEKSKATALGGEHLDIEAFANEFKPMMLQLQAQGCQQEIMAILNHIQAEQKQYPVPKGMKPKK